MIKKQYSATERDLVNDWAEKWLELAELINELVWSDEPPWSSPPPTETDELDYQRLSLWFINHQEQFIPLWKEFYGCQEPLSVEDILDYPRIVELINNPFAHFYGPENLYRLAQQLELQGGIDIWEPSYQCVRVAIYLMIQLGKTMNKFIDWIDEQIYTSE